MRGRSRRSPAMDFTRVGEEVQGAGGRELTFIEPSGEARAAIRAYVRARLNLPA